jgi:hypothetical protein
MFHINVVMRREKKDEALTAWSMWQADCQCKDADAYATENVFCWTKDLSRRDYALVAYSYIGAILPQVDCQRSAGMTELAADVAAPLDGHHYDPYYGSGLWV